MAVLTFIFDRLFHGLAADTKPSAPNDSLFIEGDTGHLFKREAGVWVDRTATGAAAWGGLTGTLADQTDLQAELDGKDDAGLAAAAYAAAAGDLTAHAAAADPHTGYQKESEKGAVNGYAGLGAGGLVPIAQLASGTPSGTKFIRDDGTLQVPAGGGGGSSATTVETDFGSTAVFQGKFTITDAAIGATSKVLCWQAPGPYTGKGTRADEATMQPVQVLSVEPAVGSAIVRWQTPPIAGMVRETQQGFLNAAGATFDRLGNQRWPDAFCLKRIGRVRGNVKFSYVVFS